MIVCNFWVVEVKLHSCRMLTAGKVPSIRYYLNEYLLTNGCFSSQFFFFTTRFLRILCNVLWSFVFLKICVCLFYVCLFYVCKGLVSMYVHARVHASCLQRLEEGVRSTRTAVLNLKVMTPTGAWISDALQIKCLHYGSLTVAKLEL